MLNDLLAIERGMAAHWMDLVGRHEDVKDMAKGWAFRVRLTASGHISGVEIVSEAGRGALWTLRDGQHNGFPGLNIGTKEDKKNNKKPNGLLLLDESARIAHQRAWDANKTPTSRRSEVLRLLATCPTDANQVSTWPNAGHRKRIKKRYEALRPLANNPLTASVPAAFERFLLALVASPPFLDQLTAALAEKARHDGDEWLEPVRAALTGAVPLAIDVADFDFKRDAGDPLQIGAVSAALSGSDDENGADVTAGQCALSGKSAKLHSGNFPQPNLPGLGQTYIFSRNKDIPSLTRYGRTADASFPIDSELVRRLAGAITKLTSEDDKGRSWRLVPAETGEKSDLLITSIASDPETKLADAVAEDDEDDAASGKSAWNELGARLIKQSHGVYKYDFPQEEVVVLILRTVDPANRKVIYHRNTTSEAIWKSAQRWQAATSNAPAWLRFPAPGKSKSELVFRKPPYLAPLSITPLSRTLFANGGRRRVDVIGVTAAEAFGLFLREGDIERRARGLLRLLVQRHGALLSSLAAARFKGIEHLKDFDPKNDLRRDALRSVTWIGALLYQLGRFSSRDLDMPEHIIYTDDVAFQLGQFLAVADVIHVGYCADLRGGDVPPTLLGNSVLAIAGSDPMRALSILQTRLKPYLGWARRSDAIYTKAATEEGKGNKGRAIALRQGASQARRASEIADGLHALLAPYKMKDKTPDDTFRAELLLGYVAGLPPLSKKDTVDPSNSQNDAVIQYAGDEA